MILLFVFALVDPKIEIKYIYLTQGTSREKLAQRGKCREKARRAFRSREVGIRVKRQLCGRVGPMRLCWKPTSLNRGWFEISEGRVFRGRMEHLRRCGGRGKKRERVKGEG